MRLTSFSTSYGPAFMTTDSQKEREMNYAIQLAEIMGKSWKIEFPPNESEWPDLLINDGTEQFGLEIREITKDPETKKGSKRKANESRNLKKIQALAEGYYEISSVPLKVGILGEFDDGARIKDALVKFANVSVDWANERIDLGHDLKIYVTRLPKEAGIYSRWGNVGDRSGWVRKVDSEFIRPFVSEKESRINKYKTHVKDVRLLLVADRTYSSGMLEFQEGSLKIEAAFNEIYVLEYPDKVHLLSSPCRSD